MAADFASRYARAFAQVVAAAHLDVNAVAQQLDDFAQTLAGSDELREIFENPSLPHEQKLKVLDAISSRIGMFKQTRNFIAVLIDHQRLNAISEVLADYAGIADAERNISDVDITSAHELNQDDRANLEQQVAKLAGGQVRATYHQDATLLGGAIVRIGSRIYDGSIRAQLQGLRRQLENA